MYSSILNKKEDFNEIKRLQEYIKSANNFEELEIYDLCKRAYENCSKSLNNSEIKNNEIYKNFTESLNQYFNQKKSIMETLIFFEEEKKKSIEKQKIKENKDNDLLKIYETNANELNQMLNQIESDLNEINKKFEKKIEESYIMNDNTLESFVIFEKNDLKSKKGNSSFDDIEKFKEFISNIKNFLEDVKENIIKLEEYYKDILKYEKAKIKDNEKLKNLKTKYLELDKKIKKSLLK